MKCNDYKPDRRNDIFDRLCIIWGDAKNDKHCDPSVQACWKSDIWRKANTLQALVQYWRTTDDKARRQKALDMMWEAYQFYADYIKNNDVWVDDFGWWAGFFRDFRSATQKLPPPLPKPFSKDGRDLVDLQKETELCYTKMLVNFDDQKKGIEKFYTGHGGVWNHRPKDVNDGNCSDCERNTVTNAWMLNVASDLYGWVGSGNPERNRYKEMAEAQYRWLTTGKYGSYSPEKWDLYTPYGLLWWLPGAPNTGRQCPDGTDACMYWSGDEGVFLRGIASYVSTVDPANKDAIKKSCKRLILDAIAPTEKFSERSAWKGFPDTQNVMHESPASAWNNDLGTGKGVFMRLVTRVAREWKYFDDKDFERRFKAFVNATAQSAWCSGDKPTGTTAPNWNPKHGPSEESAQPISGGLWPWVHQTNGLDALNAAWEIS